MAVMQLDSTDHTVSVVSVRCYGYVIMDFKILDILSPSSCVTVISISLFVTDVSVKVQCMPEIFGQRVFSCWCNVI